MAVYTSTQLATRVLKDLGLIGAEETPSSADLNWAIETVQAEIQMLNAIGIVIWNGSEAIIPNEYLTVLSRRIGLAVAPSFGLGDIAAATQAMELLDVNLRRIGQIGPTGAVVTGEYF